MRLVLDPGNVNDYRTFIKAKELPRARVVGTTVEFPDEYAHLIGLAPIEHEAKKYKPLPGLFDYQEAIARIAIERRKFCVFADCGLGKTLIITEFVRAAMAALPKDRPVLIVSPLMVIEQTIAECEKFYGKKLRPKQIRANELAEWMVFGRGVGITNYEAITDELPPGNIGALILDESSMLKSHYGKWGTRLIEMGRGLDWKLCATGTPAPNDRIEYANHAVFMDAFPTTNAFLARFFVNRGQTDNRWELKAHAVQPFYRALSDWAIFLTNPGTYGWKDNAGDIPPIHIHIERIGLTTEQRDIVQTMTGELFVDQIGGIVNRSRLSQLAKGKHAGGSVLTLKTAFIEQQVRSWPGESTIIWCHFNDEQEKMAATFPDAGNITGDTPYEERIRIVDGFKAGTIKILISKPKIMGFGLNLQIATRHVFSGLQDSYESFYQAVKRSNRYGSTMPLNVHIPVTEIEEPMIATVLSKARRVESDTREQERMFHANRPA